MADEADKDLEAAEKAYAAAAEATPAKPEPVKAEPVAAAPPAPEPAAAKPAPLKAELVKTAPKAKKTASAKSKPAAKTASKTLPKLKAVVKPKPVAKPLAAKPAKATTPVKSLPKAAAAVKPIIALKEKIMAKTPDFTKSVSDTVSELQTKAKAAYEKSTEVAGEVTEFAKGNVEALVESGKIFGEGFQDLGKTYVEEAKSAFETATADLKEMAAVKSPTELFQLQGKLLRRNFDSLVAFSSKSNEAMTKLAKEGFAPLSSRVSLAADKVSKAA